MKKIILLLCVVCLLTLIACKQDATKNSQSEPANTQSNTISGEINENKNQGEISGIQLEDDVFDEPDASTQGDQSNDNFSNKEESNDTTTSKNESTESKTENGTTDDTTEDSTSNSESSGETSSDEATVEEGIVKLPIDRFD